MSVIRDLKKTLYLGIALAAKLLVGLYAVRISAEYLGPESFGITGQLNGLLSIVSLLTGAGVSAGIAKVYSDIGFESESRRVWLRSARILAAISAAILCITILLSASWISIELLNQFEYANWLIFGIICSIIPVSYAGIGLGCINGSHRDDIYALSVVIGSVLGLIGFWLMKHYLGPLGVFLGLIWLVIAQSFVTILFAQKNDYFSSGGSVSNTSDLKVKIKYLFGYSILSITAGAVIPVAYIFIRLLLQQHSSAYEFGLWQATWRISEAYNQLPLVLLSVVLFSRFASSAAGPIDIKQAVRAYTLMGLVMVSISCFVYLTRQYWIAIVFTASFAQMENYVLWQLVGDCMKVMSYLGTTILAARGALKICILGEFLQGALIVIFNVLLVPKFSVYGVFSAYIISYAIYCAITVVVLFKVKRYSA